MEFSIIACSFIIIVLLSDVIDYQYNSARETNVMTYQFVKGVQYIITSVEWDNEPDVMRSIMLLQIRMK